MKNLEKAFGLSPADLAANEALDKRVEQARKKIMHSDNNMDCPKGWDDTKECSCEADGFVEERDANVLMLEALKKCDSAFVAWQVGQIPGRPEDILALIVEVRAAIAKAEGGAQ